jgi:exportin-T
MDMIVRYSVEVQHQPNLIPPILEFFVSRYGIHSPEPNVQLRAWYLFGRLLSKFQKDISPISEQIMTTFTDLLVIQQPAELRTSIESVDSDSENESGRDIFFYNQLYLYQSAGLLTALAEHTNSEIFQALIEGLEGTINENMRSERLDQQGVHYVHHSIMALGDIAKGFDSVGEVSSEAHRQRGIELFYPVSETVLKATSTYQDFGQIRDAVYLNTPSHAYFKTRYAFSRFVAVMGENILDKIPALIRVLLGKSTTGELIDFLPFLGQLIHKFRVIDSVLVFLTS